MRIAVTGASGNAGTALLAELQASGEHELVGVSRRPPPDAPPYRGVDWYCTDIGTPGAADDLKRAFTGADAVVHLAWLIQPQRQREVMRRANQDGTAAVADAAVRAGVGHLVHQSSIGAYAPGHGRRVDESWPATGIPSSMYSRDKAAAEQIVTRAEAHLLVSRTRPALMFQDVAASEVSRYFLGPLVPNALVRRSVLRFAPFPDALAFQVVHSADVARAIHLILQQRVGGAFNIAAAPVIDRAGFRAVFGGVGPPAPPSVLRAMASVTWRARLQQTEPGWVDLAAQVPVMVTDRIEALGWRPTHSATEVLGRFVDAISRSEGRAGPLLEPGGQPGSPRST